MTALVKQEQNFSLAPRSFAEAKEYAMLIANSDLAPKDYRGKPANVIVAVQMGQELGLSPLQSLANIAVINGRASVWGDALLAICQRQPDFEDITEVLDGEGDAAVAICTIRRRGRSPTIRQFSVADAKEAKLWGNKEKDTWVKYPKRMLQMRARGFALRDAYADALRGLISAEEAQDIPVTARPMGAATVVQQAPVARPSRTEQARQALGAVDVVAEPVNEHGEVTTLDAVLQRIMDAASVDELIAVGKDASGLAGDEKNIVRDAYRAKREALKQTEVAPGLEG